MEYNETILGYKKIEYVNDEVERHIEEKEARAELLEYFYEKYINECIYYFEKEY